MIPSLRVFMRQVVITAGTMFLANVVTTSLPTTNPVRKAVRGEAGGVAGFFGFAR